MPSAPDKTRVLVVDDEPLIVASLEFLLSEYWEVHGAHSADGAREVLRRENIAVVVADVRMPAETGVDLLAWCHEHHPSVIRILLTGFADIDAAIDAINRARAWYYVRKPWNNRELVMLLRRAIEFRAKELELQRNFQGTIRSLVVALEANHPYTCGHSTRVTAFTRHLGQLLDLGSRKLADFTLAAQLHDIGKIGVDSHYLDKAGELTEAEWADVRSHVDVGAHIIRQTGFLDHILPFAVSHHERLDGRGYPLGLSGAEIPLGGRIIAIADAFDAMASDRAYRRAMPVAAALAQLRAGAGTQFDGDLVELFCASIERDGVPAGVDPSWRSD